MSKAAKARITLAGGYFDSFAECVTRGCTEKAAFSAVTNSAAGTVRGRLLCTKHAVKFCHKYGLELPYDPVVIHLGTMYTKCAVPGCQNRAWYQTKETNEARRGLCVFHAMAFCEKHGLRLPTIKAPR